MARSEYNNPTEVIMRLMVEYQAWIDAYEELVKYYERYVPPELHHFIPPRPRAEEFRAQEAYRRAKGGKRTRYVREAMRRLRSRGDDGSFRIRYQKSNDPAIVDKVGELPTPQLTEEQIKAEAVRLQKEYEKKYGVKFDMTEVPPSADPARLDDEPTEEIK